MIRLLVTLLLSLVVASAPALGASRFTSERISVEVRGRGPDVVLIPGLCSHPEVWDGTTAAVPGYRYHLVQIAGFAGSPSGANGKGPILSPVTDEIARYIRDAKLKRPAIVGHSLGGTLAMMIAARHKRLTSRIMVVDMFPFLGMMFGPPGTTSESIRPTAEKIRDQFGSKTGDERLRSIERSVATMVHKEELRPLLTRHALECDVAVGRQAYFETLTTDLRPDLRKIRIPMVVLWQYPPGAPDSPYELDRIYRHSFANAPQAIVKQVPDAWHFIMLDKPDVFQLELRQFLGG